MTSVDEDLREQSKLLLRRLKEKQTRLQGFVDSTDGGESCSNEVVADNKTSEKPLQGTTVRKSPVKMHVQNGDGSTNIKEKFDTSLYKSVGTPSREGRVRLHRRRTKSREEANITGLKTRRVDDNKENLEELSPTKSLHSKQIYSDDRPSTSNNEYLSSATYDTNTDLSYIRKEVEEQYMDHLKSVSADKETSANEGSATPNTARRRQIINRNVKVNGETDLNASELLKECEDDFTRLNYSYSNVEDSDLKFLQERLRGPSSGAEDVPVRDTDPSVGQYSTNLDNPGNSRRIAKFIKETKKPKSILLSTSSRHNKSNASNSSRVSFRSPTRDNSGHLSYQMDSFSKHQQKMLGYDWIAALIENDSNAVNQSETFFEELKEFRKLNLEECVNSMYMDPPQELFEHPEREPSPVQRALEETKVKPYVVNDRLFPEPVQRSLFAGYDYQEPEARKDGDREPTYDEPRFVRVSIPRSTLMPSHRVKPHRRNSLEAADSMALSEHCQKGWNSSQPTMVPASSNIALRDSTKGIKSAMKTTLDEAEKLAANYPYHWDPQEQTICRPLPKFTYRPESSYADSTWPTAMKNTSSSVNQSSDGLKKATDDLLNSTHSLMYEMKRLKMERSDDPIRL